MESVWVRGASMETNKCSVRYKNELGHYRERERAVCVREGRREREIIKRL